MDTLYKFAVSGGLQLDIRIRVHQRLTKRHEHEPGDHVTGGGSVLQGTIPTLDVCSHAWMQPS